MERSFSKTVYLEEIVTLLHITILSVSMLHCFVAPALSASRTHCFVSPPKPPVSRPHSPVILLKKILNFIKHFFTDKYEDYIMDKTLIIFLNHD